MIDSDQIEQRLSGLFSKRGYADYTVEALEQLTGGSASQTWRFNLVCAGLPTCAILRTASPGELSDLGINKTLEAAVQSHAVACGVKAPRILAVLQPCDELGEGFVMEYIKGEAIPQKILRKAEYRQALPKMAEQCGQLLADIHAVPVEGLGGLPNLSVVPQLAHLEAMYKGLGELVPIFDFAFHYLKKNIPRCDRQTLIHGDFRNGNFLVDETGIVSILDWELAHLGDPMEDLGWLCVNSWRFGNSDKPVGGFGQRRDLYRAYREASGLEVDEAAVHFWEMVGVLKWGVICLYQASVYLSGADRSVNRAAIGRRVSETELDLLALLSHITAEV